MNCPTLALRRFSILLLLAVSLGARAFAQAEPGAVLIPAGSVWKFWQESAAPASSWNTLGFDDSGWKSGPAQLGYGDGDEKTVTGPAAEGSRPMATYFRKVFEAGEIPPTSLWVELIRDDGAVVYLNGREVARDNMPAGAIELGTAALRGEGPDTENQAHRFIFGGEGLQPGRNVLAVEVHQVNASSSDLSFDLELRGTLPPRPIEVPMVGIWASQPTTSEPLPAAFVRPGEFTVTRRESSLEAPLRVELRYGGSADESDYEALPASVLIPAGKESVTISLLAKGDDKVEGTEVVSALIRPVALPGLPGSEVRAYGIMPLAARAEVRILDEDAAAGPPIVSLFTVRAETMEPGPTVRVAPGLMTVRRLGPVDSPLEVGLRYEGNATPGRDYAELKESIVIPAGASEAELFIAAMDDEVVEGDEIVVVHLREDRLAPEPRYTVDPEQSAGRVVIHDNETASQAVLRLRSPEHGAEFPPGSEVRMQAAAIDPTGYIARIEFYAGDQLAGVSELTFIVAPEPGSVIEHEFAWPNAPLGSHVIYAKAKRADGSEIFSNKAEIIVREQSDRPLVSVRFVEHETDELWPDADFAPGSIEIRRSGLTTGKLPVHVALGGSAIPGVDYEKIELPVIIPEGQAAVRIKVAAIDDSLAEGNESVEFILRLPPEEISATLRAPYLIDRAHAAAAVVILDNERPNGRARIAITRPVSGEQFAEGKDVSLEAVAVDLDGYISRLEFHAGEKLIGVSELVFIQAPAPGTPIHHALTWTNPPPGAHTLLAVGQDSAGRRVSSEPVRILVGPPLPEGQVVLAISVTDPDAAEVEEDGSTDRAHFVIRRVGGPTDVAVPIYYRVSGTAAHGIDYVELPSQLVLPAGRKEIELEIRPIPDKALENEETVILTLLPPACVLIFPPPASCYLMSEPASAQAVIRDQVGVGEPRVVILRPRDGAVFETDDEFTVRVEASDRGGKIERLDLYGNDQLLASTKESRLEYEFEPSTAGEITLTARALDDSGVEARSKPVRVMIRSDDDEAFVQRALPDSYAPGVPFTVSLKANPPGGTQAYAIEETPPRGWTVAEISHEGTFDTETGKVKFGPFTDSTERTLTYAVTPSREAAGNYSFAGVASANGRVQRIGGDRSIRGSETYHPADLNTDWRITVAELTAYAAAWKVGEVWRVPPTEIPIGYMTRGAMLWHQGEKYHADGAQGAAPLLWVSDLPPPAQTALAARGFFPVLRTVTPGLAGGPLEVVLVIEPAERVRACAAEEKVPAGWKVAGISHEGTYDAKTGCIRWGPFLDATPRRLSYQLSAPEDMAAVSLLRGVVSFDGVTMPIAGLSRVVAETGGDELHLPRCEKKADGSVQLELRGAAGQLCTLETSIDLIHWTEVNRLFLPAGRLEYQDDTAAGQPRRYYRLIVK